MRLCVTCGQLKSADQFKPRQRKCRTCQARQGHHPDGAHKQPGQAAVCTRARDRAPRRLAAEHVEIYRQLKAQRLATAPAALPRQRAQGRAVSQALSELGKQYPQYYRALYEQELERARSEPAPIRRGRPPGGPRPTLAGIRIVDRDMAPGEPGRKPAEPTDPRRPPPGRARGGPAPRRRTVRQRDADVVGRRPARRGQADRGQLARPLAGNRRRSVAKPWAQPTSGGSR